MGFVCLRLESLLRQTLRAKEIVDERDEDDDDEISWSMRHSDVGSVPSLFTAGFLGLEMRLHELLIPGPGKVLFYIFFFPLACDEVKVLAYKPSSL